VSYLGRAQRWAKLLSRAGLRLPLGRAWCLTLLGVGYGLVTPGKVGEFARVLHLGVPRAQAGTRAGHRARPGPRGATAA